MKNKTGFTLIELLITISIIGILSMISLFALQGIRASARDDQRKNDLALIRSQLELYKSDCDKYPDTTAFPAAGATLNGDGSSSSCLLANIYIASRPKDPLTEREYYYSGGATTYVLCAAFEGGGSDVCPGTCNSSGSTTLACNYKTINP
ncbi:MAG: prepilin-type N-terminal cleavage/methylation domain-containing protein [Patescibacteria group bacterium]